MPDIGLRERKKRRTRETIVREALRLFADRGFDAVTVADIAEAADIAPRTFFAYFPSKEDVVFADMPEALEGLRERLAERPPETLAIDALRAWILDAFADIDPADAQERCRRELVNGTPALEARRAAKMAEFETVLREGIAQDLGEPADALRPRLVAAAVVAALDALDAAHAAVLEDPEAVLDEAIEFLRAGVSALQGRTPARPAV